MKIWKRVMPLCMASAMVVSVPLSVSGVSPEFARTAEEWAKLQDNVMEYGELADLIHEYNVTVQTNQIEYRDYQGKTRDDIAQQYRDLADALYAGIGGSEDEYASMISELQIELQAKQYQEKADDNVDDGIIVKMNYDMAEDNLTVVAQSNMITYHKNLLALQAAEKNLQLQQANYNSVVVKAGIGSATQIDLLTAQEALQNSQQAVRDAQTAINSVRQRLCVMLGWTYDAQPDIQPVPEPDLERIAAMNPILDKETALEKNYTLRINKRKLENSQSGSKRESLEKTIRSNEQQIGASLTSAYQSVQAAKIAYDQSAVDLALASKTMNTAAVQYQLGTISALEYQTQENNLMNKQIAEQTAKLGLFEAIETYNWNVNGLAKAD